MLAPPVVCQLRMPVSQRADGASEATHLGDVAGVGPGIQQLEGVAGAVDGGGAVDIAGDLFKLPGGVDLAVGVAGV